MAAAEMNINVHIVATPASQNAPILTAWAKETSGSYSISDTPSDNTSLVKGNKDKYNSSIITLGAVGTTDNVLKVFELQAYAEHTETDNDRKAAVVQALKTTSKSMSFEIAYDSDYVPSAANSAKLNSNEVVFFVNAASMNEANLGSTDLTTVRTTEKDGSNTGANSNHLGTVALSSLVYQNSSVDTLVVSGDTTHYVSCGYLIVRIDGSKRSGGHDNATTYSTELSITGSDVANLAA